MKVTEQQTNFSILRHALYISVHFIKFYTVLIYIYLFLTCLIGLVQ